LGLVIAHVASREQDAECVGAVVCGGFVLGLVRRVAAGRDEMGGPGKSRRAVGARGRKQAT
jgi:hypothetical protein